MGEVLVARRYKFRGRHHVPGLPAPWCEPHEHDYTVEVVARGSVDCEIVVDTDVMDRVWDVTFLSPDDPSYQFYDLDDRYGAINTTVEALARMWLKLFHFTIPEVYRVVVWEDDDRWGSAEI